MTTDLRIPNQALRWIFLWEHRCL